MEKGTARKRTVNSDMPIGKLTRTKDFLPPAQLAIPDKTIKVALSLKSPHGKGMGVKPQP